jgi:hypothetical protein
MGWLIDPESESVFIGESGKQFLIIDDPAIALPFPFVSSASLTDGEVF